MDIQGHVENAFWIGIVITLCAFVGLIVGYPIYKHVYASGAVEFCYTESTTEHVPTQPDVVLYTLYGFRAWRSDRTLSRNLTTMAQVREAADKYGCTLH